MVYWQFTHPEVAPYRLGTQCCNQHDQQVVLTLSQLINIGKWLELQQFVHFIVLFYSPFTGKTIFALLIELLGVAARQ